MWIGLSAKLASEPDEAYPLCEKTRTGKLICQIEEQLGDCSFYKTNLVKCAPLDQKCKLRYPTSKEMNTCFFHIPKEINVVKPKLVFLLGALVAKFVLNKFEIDFERIESDFRYISFNYYDTIFVPIHHPSYITIYKRRHIEHYISSITSIINLDHKIRTRAIR